MFVIIGVIFFALLIIVHELGHFWAARRNGVEVEEFGIGFPPKLISFTPKNSKTKYSFNLIPLGGFVKLKGENDNDKRKGTFGATRFVNKVKILLAGVGMNVLAAFALLLVLAFIKLPNLVPGQFSIGADERSKKTEVVVLGVLEGSPAEAAGIETGAVIESIGKQSVSSSEQLTNYTRARPNQKVQLKYAQSGEVVEKAIELSETEEGAGQLGVTPYDNTSARYSWSAPIVAAGVTLQLTWLTVKGLGLLLWGLITEGTSSAAVAGAVGPVGVFALLQNVGEIGFSFVLLLIINISLSLAVINALPLPALDGGRLALISAFRLLKKPLTPKIESAVHTTGFILLLGLIILISYFDIQRFF